MLFFKGLSKTILLDIISINVFKIFCHFFESDLTHLQLNSFIARKFFYLTSLNKLILFKMKLRLDKINRWEGQTTSHLTTTNLINFAELDIIL